MGGMSFKYPFCPKWYLDGGAFKNHLSGAHAMRNINIEGTANCITLWHGQNKYAAVALPTGKC